MDYVLKNGRESLSIEDISEIKKIPLYTEWINAGGQVIPASRIQELFHKIKSGEIENWKQVHEFYDECQKKYYMYKARYALYIIEWLYSKSIEYFTDGDYEKFLNDVAFVSLNMLESSIQVREKDYTDYFRSITYRNEAEREAVLGTLDGNGFLNKLKNATDDFEANLQKLFRNLRK